MLVNSLATTTEQVFSLLRGSGLKCVPASVFALFFTVLPLTREWIEIVEW